MKIGLQIQFRGFKNDVVSFLPQEYLFIGELLEDYVPLKVCSCFVTLNQTEADRFIAWGRQKRSGCSILRAATVYEQYELHDLKKTSVVEIFNPPDVGRCKILNFRKALNVVWICEYCDRVKGTQVDDFRLSLRQDLDMQKTYNHEWIVSARIQSVFINAGLFLRPLKMTTRFAQLLVPQRCSLKADALPAQIVSAPCPGCGRAIILRRGLIKGNPADWNSPDMNVYKDMPLTLDRPIPKNMVICKSDIEFYNAQVAKRPSHEVGAQINMDYVSSLYYNSAPTFFASSDFVARLLAMNAKGLAFRPVNVVSE